jgi:hypothetical protein
LINQLRAILLERGIAIAQGRRNLERELDAMLSKEDGLAVSPRLRKPLCLATASNGLLALTN